MIFSSSLLSGNFCSFGFSSDSLRFCKLCKCILKLLFGCLALSDHLLGAQTCLLRQLLGFESCCLFKFEFGQRSFFSCLLGEEPGQQSCKFRLNLNPDPLLVFVIGLSDGSNLLSNFQILLDCRLLGFHLLLSLQSRSCLSLCCKSRLLVNCSLLFSDHSSLHECQRCSLRLSGLRLGLLAQCFFPVCLQDSCRLVLFGLGSCTLSCRQLLLKQSF